MVIDFITNVPVHEVTSIKSQTLECVPFLKYLGTIIDSKLRFEAFVKRSITMCSFEGNCIFQIDQTLLIFFSSYFY